MMRRRGSCLVAVLSTLLACGFGEALEQVDRAVDTFHAQLNAGEYQTIYSSAHEEYRKATTEAESTEFLGAVRRKLGSVTRTTRVTWHLNYGPFGKTAIASYATQFTGGEATEQFTWRLKGDQPILVGYNINSRNLITK